MLNKTLKEMFVDRERNQEMMHGDCDHNPSCYSKFLKSTIVIDNGYAKQLFVEGIEYEIVDSYGGEDQGSIYYTVWKFTKGDEIAYFKFQGWYASYEGAEFQTVFEVKPKEVTRIEYA